MQIDIAKSELQTLRHEMWHRLQYLRATPAAAHPETYAIVATEIRVLEKFIRKLNRALTVAYGHDCHGSLYTEYSKQQGF